MLAGKHYFYTKREGMQNQPILYVRDGLDGPDRVLVDANQLAADGTIALDWFQPSENGKYVAYGTSPSGSEMSTLHVIETKTGNILPDTIERTRAASIAWKLDNSGFYYTRYPKKGEVPAGQEMYNRHVFYHELGDDPGAEDKPIFGEGRDAEDWPSVNLSNDGHWLLISVSQGWTKSELFLMDVKKGTPPTRITTGKNFLYGGEVYNDKLYVTTNEDAPRYRVFVADAGNYDREAWKELIPQSDAVLQGTAVFGGKLFAQYEQNASSQLKLFDLDGKKISDITLPAIGTVFGSGGRWNRDEMFFGFQSFTVPPSIYRVELKPVQAVTAGKNPVESDVIANPTVWTKVDAPSIDPAGYDVNQEWFQSKDGTRVPMFVVHKKGVQKNGKNPTLLTAYGGFNVSLTPSFSRTAYLWMEHGGVYAVANLRGGAEFGEDWHRAGMLDKKQNVFDDMIAAAEHLIAEKYTRQESPRHPGRLQRRPAHGRHDDAASRSVPRRRLPGPAARHAALPGFPDREAVDPGIRHVRKRRAVQVALRLLAVSPREGGHGVSRNLIYDGGYRHASRSHAREKDGGADAGGGEEWVEQDASDLVED